MFAKITGFLKSTVIYGLAGTARSFIEFLLLPLYAHYLSPADFGILDILMIYIMVGLVLAILEMNNAAFRFFYDRKTPEEKNKVISSAFWFTSANGLVIFILTFIFAGFLEKSFFQSDNSRLLFILAGAFIALSSIATVPANLLRILNRPARYTFLALLQIIISLAGIVLFLSVFKLGLAGIMAAKAIAVIPIIIISLLWARPHLTFRIDLKCFAGMLKYALPLIPAGVAIWGINGLNRLFMLHYLTLDQIGLFSIAARFAVIITLAVIAFQLAWPQFVFSNMNSAAISKAIAGIFNIAAALGLWLVLFITLFADTFIKLTMNPAFYISTKAVLPLSLGMFLYGIFYFFTTAVIIDKKTVRIILALAAALSANMIMNILVTPRYGFLGTAWTMTSSYLVMAVVMYCLVRNSKFITLDRGKLTWLGLTAGLYLLICYNIPAGHSLKLIWLKAGLVLSFPIILILTGFIGKARLVTLRGSIISRLNPPFANASQSRRLSTQYPQTRGDYDPDLAEKQKSV